MSAGSMLMTTEDDGAIQLWRIGEGLFEAVKGDSAFIQYATGDLWSVDAVNEG